MRKTIVPFALILSLAACHRETAPETVQDKVADTEHMENQSMQKESESHEESEKPGYTYSWSSNEKSKGLVAGTYTVNAADASACTFASNGTSTGSLQPTRNPIPAVRSTPQIRTPEMIIRNGNLRFSVEDYKKGRSQIEQILKAHNAYISSENEENNTYSITNTIVIRVLNKDFDALVNGLGGIAKQINTKTITSQDVTAEYVDIQARLKTKKDIEAQYLDLLKKAVKIPDILEIEEKVRVLREEIEAKEGELRLLSDQVSYSTINLVFYQNFEFAPEEHPGFLHRSVAAMGSGWISFLNFIISVLYAWPAWIILGIAGFVGMKIAKRMRVKKAVPSKINSVE